MLRRMKNDADRWTNLLMDSYGQKGGINTGQHLALPSKSTVDFLCRELMCLLFPGYYDSAPHSEDNLREITGQRLAALSDEFHRALLAALAGDDTAADTTVGKLFRELPAIRALLLTDVEAAYEGDPSARTREEIILSYPFLEAIAIQRVAHFLYRHDVPLVPRMMTEWAHALTGIDIHPGASIGSHFFIDHGTGVVIGETCRIGAQVKLYHGVTLGARSFAKDEEGRIKKGGKRHPDVEDGVTIYPNATVLGGETVIGRNSTIGGNVFLMHSVPPDSLVLFEESRVRVMNKSSRTAVVDYSI
jgi:serine O-acetyltransferase